MLLVRIRSHIAAFPIRTRGASRVQCRALSDTTTAGVKPYYVTTPIFYPNAVLPLIPKILTGKHRPERVQWNVPHIGHLYSLVTADIFARFERLSTQSRPIHFLAGTDEHGLKIQKAAQDQGLPPNIFCDKLSEKFRNLATKANVSHTRFMRTTEREHHHAVEYVWGKLDAKGLIYKGSYSGWYSVSDECFYTESQITRTPSITSPNLAISTETGSTVEWQQEENYVFRLSSFRESLLTHYTKNSRVIFPGQHQADIVQILSEAPLEDLSISRPRTRLSWGIPVPNDPRHTIYVWFDALLVYLAGIGYPWAQGTGLTEGWPANLQVIGKDILRFHAIYFPAMLQALDLPLPERLLAHAHWTVNQKKMSKSIGNVADPFEAMDEFGVDVVRYYLARVGGRFRDDVDWSHEQLDKYNHEIQAYVGNSLLRITSDRIMARVQGAKPRTLTEIYKDKESPNHQVIAAHLKLAENVERCLRDMEVAEALQHIVDLLKLVNKAITTIAPWSAEPSAAYASYLTSIESLRVVGICLQPFVPDVAERLLDALGVRAEERGWEFAMPRPCEKEDGEAVQMIGKVGDVQKGVRLFGGERETKGTVERKPSTQSTKIR